MFFSSAESAFIYAFLIWTCVLNVVEKVNAKCKSEVVFSSSVDLAIKTVCKTIKSTTQHSEGGVGVRVESRTCLGLVHSILGLWQRQPNSKRSLNLRRAAKETPAGNRFPSVDLQVIFFILFFIAPPLALRTFRTKKTAFKVHVKAHVRRSRGGRPRSASEDTRPGSAMTQAPPRSLNYVP